MQRTEVRFASLLSGGFTFMVVLNPPEKKMPNRTSVTTTLYWDWLICLGSGREETKLLLENCKYGFCSEKADEFVNTPNR